MKTIPNHELYFISGGSFAAQFMVAACTLGAILYNRYSHSVNYFIIDGPLDLDTLQHHNISCDKNLYSYCEVRQKGFFTDIHIMFAGSNDTVTQV